MTRAVLIICAVLFAVFAWAAWELAGRVASPGLAGEMAASREAGYLRWAGVLFTLLAIACARAA